MRRLEPPIPRPPHVCAVTGRSDGPVIDFEVEIAGWDPHLYLRESVVEEAGQLLGMVPKAEIDVLREMVAAQAERITELTMTVERYATAHEALQEVSHGNA